MLDLVLDDEMPLLQGLDGVDTPGIFLFSENDLPVRSFSNHFNKFKVING